MLSSHELKNIVLSMPMLLTNCRKPCFWRIRYLFNRVSRLFLKLLSDFDLDYGLLTKSIRYLTTRS